VREVLQQLSGIQGVVGALACDGGGALLASSFPPLFDDQALRQVAGLFADGEGGLRGLTGDDGALELRYSRGRAYAHPFAGGTLVVVGTAAADRQLLGLSLARATRRLEEALVGALPAAPAPPPPAAVAAAPQAEAARPQAPATPPQAAAAPPQAKPAALAAEVERIVKPLRQALIRQIGPFGDVAFDEKWAAWARAAPPSRGRLRLLVDALATEVDDEEARLAFFVEACALIA